MNMHRIVVIVTLLICSMLTTSAGIQLDSWYTYTNRLDGDTHYSFDLSKVKRGLFLGPCGFSTSRTEWLYSFDLAGSSLSYDKAAIRMEDFDSKKIPVFAGTILINTNMSVAHIALQISNGEHTTNFIGNGVYKIIKLK
jgi:hypothetical protein